MRPILAFPFALVLAGCAVHDTWIQARGNHRWTVPPPYVAPAVRANTAEVDSLTAPEEPSPAADPFEAEVLPPPTGPTPVVPLVPRQTVSTRRVYLSRRAATILIRDARSSEEAIEALDAAELLFPLDHEGLVQLTSDARRAGADPVVLWDTLDYLVKRGVVRPSRAP